MSAGILCTDNVTMTAEVEKTGQDSAGGSTPTWTSVATGIGGLFTQVSGNRSGDFHADAERTRATFTSDDSTIGRSDVRLKVTAVSDASLSDLVGTYWRVESTAGHPAGRGGLRDARYTAQLSRWVNTY